MDMTKLFNLQTTFSRNVFLPGITVLFLLTIIMTYRKLIDKIYD